MTILDTRSPFALSLVLVGTLTTNIFSPQEAQATDLKSQSFKSESDWQAANAAFLETYNQEKKHIISHLGPVLICGHESLTLLNGPNKQTLPLKSALTDHLKIGDHEVLELYLILRDHTGRTLDSDTIAKLNAIKKTLAETERTVFSSNLADVTKTNVLSLLNRSLAFLELVLAARSVSETELQNFTRSVGKDALANVDFAMKAYLDELGNLTQRLIKPLPPADIERLHVIVFGSHMAEKDNAEVQFFEKYLGETSEGMKIIFCDEQIGNDAALDLLATHILDASIGKSFFGDPWRMHRDVRGDAAHRYLQEHGFTPLTKK
jgi:hypothetical protein